MDLLQRWFGRGTPSSVPPPLGIEQKQPGVGDTGSFDAMKIKVPDAFATPPNHPRSNRQTRLHGVELGYHLRRSARRSIGLVVRPEGLSVAAPRWVTQAQVDQVLQDKAAWVLKKLAQMHQHAPALPPATDWHDGATLPYLGAPLRLALDPAHPAGAADLLPPDGEHPARLRLGLPVHALAPQIRDAAHAWLARQALALFTQRLDHYAPQLGVRWHRLTLTQARTRWGSAKADGSIRLNRQLVHLPLALIDYVVVHELSHLREMNHGPQFWATVGRVLPDWPERRRALRQTPLHPL